MNLNMQSIIKAAVVAIVVGGILGVLGQIPLLLPVGTAAGVISTVTGLISCCAGFLLPIIVGALYGYFTVGEETLAEAAAGGAISAALGGVVYGILNTIVGVIIQVVVNGLEFGAAFGIGSIIGVICVTPILSAIFGAIGGAIWTLVQKRGK